MAVYHNEHAILQIGPRHEELRPAEAAPTTAPTQGATTTTKDSKIQSPCELRMMLLAPCIAAPATLGANVAKTRKMFAMPTITMATIPAAPIDGLTINAGTMRPKEMLQKRKPTTTKAEMPISLKTPVRLGPMKEPIIVNLNAAEVPDVHMPDAEPYTPAPIAEPSATSSWGSLATSPRVSLSSGWAKKPPGNPTPPAVAASLLAAKPAPDAVSSSVKATSPSPPVSKDRQHTRRNM